MSKEAEKQKLLETDTAFAAYAQAHGVAEAFRAYSKPNVIHLGSGGFPHVGLNAVVEQMAQFEQTYTMHWSPLKVNVNPEAGTGVTAGKYELHELQKDAPPKHLGTGKYLTIWQKNMAQEWKVVYDMDGELFED